VAEISSQGSRRVRVGFSLIMGDLSLCRDFRTDLAARIVMAVHWTQTVALHLQGRKSPLLQDLGMARLEHQVWTVVDCIGHDLSETRVLEAGDPLIAVSPVSGHTGAADHEMPLSRVLDGVVGNHAEALENDLRG